MNQSETAECFCECWNCQDDDHHKCKYKCQITEAYAEE